jgi:taurine dioxygenase
MSLSHYSSSKSPFEQWNTRERRSYRTIDVTPVSPTIGAEVEGIDLRADLSPEQFSELRSAIAENLVLVFRDQELSREEHKRFASRFGALHQHKLAGDTAQGSPNYDPNVLAWKTGRESRYTAGEAWHSDVSCDEKPIWGSFLRVTRQPEVGGGDTAFANMYLAFESLSEPIRNLLSGLTAIHDGAHAWTRGYSMAPKPGQTFPVSEHPVVATHPVTDRQFLYVNAGFTSHIPQLSRPESDALLQFLYQHIERNLILQTRIRWTPNALVFWDNWATQHHAVWDYYPFERWGERVSVVLDKGPQR